MSAPDYSLPPGPLRSDAPLIRHLARPGDILIPGNPAFDVPTIYPKLAQTYRRLPLFVLPDNIPWLFEHEKDLEPFLFEPLHRPYDDLILDFPLAGDVLFQHVLGSAPATSGPHHLWVRVRSVLQALHDPDLIWPAEFLRQPLAKMWEKYIPPENREPPGAPISEDDILDSAAHWILFEFWYFHPTGVSHFPSWTIIPGDEPCELRLAQYFDPPESPSSGPTWNPGKLLDQDPGPPTMPPSFEAVRHFMLELEEAHVRAVLLALVYLTEIATLLRVSPPPTRSPKEQRTQLLKPWLAPHEHAIISIDPARLAEFHHPSATQTINVRHAPRPHSRRGHWRTLPKDWDTSRTWIRPTWVGAREWQDPQGNTYVFLPSTEQVLNDRRS